MFAASETRKSVNEEDGTMTQNTQWEQVAGKWKQFSGEVK
jgi:hypothetical protein